MKHSRKILALMARKLILILFISLSTSESQCQTDIPPAGSLCISDCETCPVICSPPPSPSSSSPPPSPKLPPPPPPPRVHHYSPPQPYYFTSPSPSSPPAHPPPPPPPPPSSISWGGVAGPPPPSVYVYNPGTTVPAGMGQRNLSFPYYYFYSSKASCYLPLHQGSILVVVFIFFQVLYG